MEQRFCNRLLHLINEEPKPGKLNQEQKDFNRQLSQKKVYVEHVIRVLDQYSI